MKCISENWSQAKVTSIPTNKHNFVLPTIKKQTNRHYQNSHQHCGNRTAIYVAYNQKISFSSVDIFRTTW